MESIGNERKVSINKISPPTLGTVLSRERLFEALDLSPPTSAVWLSGPGGSGKSTLIADFLAVNKIPCLWYQMDSGDEDLSTFFYYLGQAASRLLVPNDPPLPLLTPEYRLGVETFARRYFENLFQRLEAPCWIVFDNYQEVPTDSDIAQIMYRAIEQLPRGITMTVISRSNPPPAIARLQANRLMKCLDWKELAFTFDEFSEVLTILCRDRLTDQTQNDLYQLTQGWIAGVVLWLLRFDTEPASQKPPSDHTQEFIFDYFAGEVLAKIDTETRDFLLKTSFLAEVNPDAANQLINRKDSHHVLKRLSHNNFFLEKRAGSSPKYQYHPLFLSFLRKQAGRHISAEELSNLRCRAATIAAASGAVEHAVTLYQEAATWDELIDLIQLHAPSLYFQGRLRTLSKWLRHLPQNLIAGHPWLLFWQGVGHLPHDPLKGRKYCKRSYEEFRQANDTLGQILSFAAAVESFFILRSDMRGLDFWISQGEELDTAADDIDDPNISGRFAAAMLGSLTIRAPSHPSIGKWIQRCTDKMSQSTDLTLHIMLGNLLVLIHCWHGNVDKANIILQRLKPSFDNYDTPPLQQILFNVMQCVFCLASGESKRCLRIAENAQTISQNTGVHVYDGLICSYGVYGSLANGDLVNARRFLNRMARVIKPHETIDIAHYHALCAWEAFVSGDSSMALTQIQTAREIGEANGAPVATVIFGRLFQARIALAAGEMDRAQTYLRDALGRSRAKGCLLFEFQELLTQAQFCYFKGEANDGNQFLKRAFEISRAKNIMDGNWWLRSQLVFFCQKALEANIEIEQVLRFIDRHQLLPDDPRLASPSWPWPVKIYTLGCFKIFLQNRLLKLSVKAPKKPLELLKMLVCYGHLGLPREAAIDQLWPDTDGDRAVQNLNTTLYRLRRMLGRDKAIVLEGNKLSLNPALCWVDAWYFENLVKQAESAANPVADTDLLAKALTIYKGHNDDHQEENAAIIGYTEKLRFLWINVVTDLGKRLAQSGKHKSAVDLLQKALNLDDRAEPIYRTLMAVFSAQGCTADALLTFNRCRNVLARQGLEPADSTMVMYRDLQTSISRSNPHHE